MCKKNIHRRSSISHTYPVHLCLRCSCPQWVQRGKALRAGLQKPPKGCEAFPTLYLFTNEKQKCSGPKTRNNIIIIVNQQWFNISESSSIIFLKTTFTCTSDWNRKYYCCPLRMSKKSNYKVFQGNQKDVERKI